MHYFTAVSRRDYWKFPRLRFQLRKGKTIRERGQNKYVCISVIPVHFDAWRDAEPLALCVLFQILWNVDLYWTNKPELDVFAREQLDGIE